MMECHKKFWGAAKEGGGAWTRPMHPLFISFTTKDPPLKIPPT
jgi:hypothetical protein